MSAPNEIEKEKPLLDDSRHGTEKTATTEDGRQFQYEVHIDNPTSPNLVVFIPGFDDDGIDGHTRLFKDQSDTLEANAITFSYTQPFNPEVFVQAIKAMVLNPDNGLPKTEGIILYITSLGGIVLSQILNDMEIRQTLPIKGVVMQGPMLGRENISRRNPLFRTGTSKAVGRLIALGKPILGQQRSHSETRTAAYDPKLVWQEYQAFMQQESADLPQNINLPAFLIRFDKDRIVDDSTEEILRNSFPNLETAEFPSLKKDLGHGTEDWKPVMDKVTLFSRKALGIEAK